MNADAELAIWLRLAEPWMYAGLLAMGRAGGLLMALPNTSGRSLPKQVKAIVVIAVSVALVVSDPSALRMATRSEIALAWALAMEVLLGLGLGFVIHAAFAAVRIAGEVAGVEMGLSFAAVADPMSQGQTTAVSAIVGQLGIQLYLALGLDRTSIAALAVSVDHQSLGSASLGTGAIRSLVDLADGMFRAGLGFALPLIGALLALKLAMAMLARVAPRLQIFTLAFALAIGVGMVLLHAALPSIGASIAEHLRHHVALLFRLAAAASGT